MTVTARSSRSKSRKAAVPQTAEALLQLRADVDAEIARQKREKDKIDTQLKALAKQAQLDREKALGRLVYAAGLGDVDDALLRIEFALLAQRLCGVQRVIQVVEGDGYSLVRTVEEMAEVEGLR